MPPPPLPTSKASQSSLAGGGDGAQGQGGPTTDDSFAYTKDVVDVIARRPSFSESLARSLEGKDPVAPGVKRGGGFLSKQSTTGRWSKRFFVVHGHYLSYFKDAAAAGKPNAVPTGTLDLWHVESCTLEDNIIYLQLSDRANEARREDMGSKAIREVKKIAHNAPGPVASIFLKRLETIRRGATSPRLALKADTSQEAQLWLGAMRDSPFMGQLAKLASEAGAEPPTSPSSSASASSSALSGSSTAASAGAEESFHIQELKIVMPGNRQYVYTDAAALFDGVTRVLIRDIPLFGGRLTITAKSRDGAATETVSAPFEPPMTEQAGVVAIPLVHLYKGKSAFARVEWRRHSPSVRRALAAAGSTLTACFLILFIVGMPFVVALATATAAAGGAAFSVWSQQRKRNNVVIVDASARVGATSEEVSQVRHSPSVPTSSASAKASATSKTQKISTQGVARSPDLNVTLEESAQLKILRERVKDLWDVNPTEADAFVKKYRKLLEEWAPTLTRSRTPRSAAACWRSTSTRTFAACASSARASTTSIRLRRCSARASLCASRLDSRSSTTRVCSARPSGSSRTTGRPSCSRSSARRRTAPRGSTSSGCATRRATCACSCATGACRRARSSTRPGRTPRT